MSNINLPLLRKASVGAAVILALLLMLGQWGRGLLISQHLLVKDYERYTTGGTTREVENSNAFRLRTGSERNWFEIIPGFIQLERARVKDAIFLQITNEEMKQAISEGKAGTVTIKSLVIRHANGEKERKIAQTGDKSSRSFAIHKKSTEICRFKHQKDDFVIKISGKYIRPEGDDVNFSLSELFKYEDVLSVSMSRWYFAE